jgi:hypothetical protein
MANKKLLYNENGTNAEIANSGSLPAVYFDDATNTLVAQGLVINKVTASIGSTNGILGTDANGKLTTIPVGSNGQYLQSDGTSWAFRDASGVATGDYLSPSDLSGPLSAPTVTSIQYVVSGTLSAQNGGTGVSSFTSGGLLVKDSTSTIKFVRPDAGASVLRPDGSGSWYSGGSTGTASYNVSGAYYTGSGTWIKPVGHRNVKVILMGGGGGGGVSTTGGTARYGGGAGGFSIYDFINTEKNLSANITVGTGGTGSIGAFHPFPAPSPGQPGGTTIFSSSNIYFIAGGGQGGGSTLPSSAEGYGNITNNKKNICSGGGGRGGGDSDPLPGEAGNSARLLASVTASGGAAALNNPSQTGLSGSPGMAITSSIGIPGFYAMFGGGGGGGYGKQAPGTGVGGAGGNGIYGSGGGAAGSNGLQGVHPVDAIKRGGTGGDGYAIIISW